MREAVVVGELGAELGALLVAQRREVRVWDLLVLVVEVVETLGVPDKMDCDGHGGRGGRVGSSIGSVVSRTMACVSKCG